MKKEVIVCDNCGADMPDDTEPVRIGQGAGRPRTFDICTRCIEPLVSMSFEARGTNIDRLELEESRRRERLVVEKMRQREEEISEARKAVAESIEAWARGEDPRELLRSAAARLARGV